MNSHKIVATIAAAALALGSIGALAQPRENQRNQNRGDDRGHQRADPRDQQRGGEREGNGQGRREENRENYRQDNREGNRAGNRGAGPDHSFYRGGRLPSQFRSNRYVVEDWRGHHLNAPPRGYHWVQTGGDYVLVAIATGIIASILLNQ
jgi:Ni/Co efflux regulator RcnB